MKYYKLINIALNYDDDYVGKILREDYTKSDFHFTVAELVEKYPGDWEEVKKIFKFGR